MSSVSIRLSLALLVVLAASAVLPSLAGAQSTDSDPRFGEYVYVDELPVLLTSVAPIYPEAAKRLGIDGTVIVRALVGKDGRVKDVSVAKSIAMLDQAAVQAVKQFVFKPAQAGGEPVAVRVAVPVRFSAAGNNPPDVGRGPVPPPSPTEPKPSATEFGDLLAALRSAGPRAPSRSDAGLRERIIRAALRLEPRPEIPSTAREHFDRGLRATAQNAPPETALVELASALLEAPWWAEPYREIARYQERLGLPADAMTSLNLYLVASPDAADGENVRLEIARLKEKIQPLPKKVRAVKPRRR